MYKNYDEETEAKLDRYDIYSQYTKVYI